MVFNLTGSVAKGIGKALIPGLWNSGLTPNRIYKALRFDYKLSWRRTDMFKEIRDVTGLMRHERQIRGIDPTKELSRYLIYDMELPSHQNYRLYAEIDVYNELTGEYSTKRISWYTDDFTSPSQAMADYISFESQTGSQINEYIVGWTFQNASHNKGNPW